MSENKLKVSDQFIMREIAGESFLIPVAEAAIAVKGLIALSESGTLIYEKLKESCTRAELIKTLSEEYDVGPEDAAADTDAFLEQMKQLNMLVEE